MPSALHRLALRALTLLSLALPFALSVALPFALPLPAAAQLTTVGDGGPGPVKADHLTAELTSLAPNLAPGSSLDAGLVLTMEEHWHVYWINAGDAGEPPHITWTLPAGITVSELSFPPPQRLPLGPLMDFGYEDQVAYPFTITAAPGLKPGRVHLDALVTWLVCADRCLPGRAHLGLDVNIVPGPLPTPPRVGALGEALNNLPRPLPATMSATAVADASHVLLKLHTGSDEQDAEFYPFAPAAGQSQLIAYSASQTAEPVSGGVDLRMSRLATTTGQPAPLPGSLNGLVELSSTESYVIHAPLTAGVLPAAARAPHQDATATVEITAFSAIGLALLGGILLNLMPCVFPVLFLKGLALVHTSQQQRSHQRLHGLIYTLGILVSFWVIVAALLILRAGGRQLGWGFQLQSPGFVAVLALLIFFLGLSLAGQFEFGLSLTSAGGDLARKQGFAGSFFTGVLATVVATPCMGPLMGAAVGFALAQPAWLTFTVFSALALGLALPYLALSMNPQWTRFLPKPGAWMEVLKQLTAVPLFATAIWLTWVYAHLYAADGIDRMTALLAGYLLLAIAGWVLGRWPAKWPASLAALALVALAIYLPLRTPTADTLTWQPYSDASFAAARASGHPVFVDFTAAWCLSCQVNERAVLRAEDVEGALRSNHVELLRADWTQYDPAITRQLAALGRSGVPTYVIYPPGASSNPDLLPEVLSKDLVLKQIKQDAKPLGTQ